MNNYEMLSLNVDCLQNVFSFLSIKDLFSLTSAYKKFDSKNNDFWKKTCSHLLNPLPQLDFNLRGSVHTFLVQKQFNEELIQILRDFFNTVSRGKLEFNVRNTPFLTFKINNRNDESPRISKKIKVKQEFVRGLKLSPVNKAFDTYPSEAVNPFFIITKEEFSQVRALAAPFHEFLENQHKKVGCDCKKTEKCESFIKVTKQEMQSYFKDRVSKDNSSAIIKKIENVSLNTFTSEDQMKILAETFPSDLKLSFDRYLLMNQQIKQGKSFELTYNPRK
jgi:hypothetical protein